MSREYKKDEEVIYERLGEIYLGKIIEIHPGFPPASIATTYIVENLDGVCHAIVDEDIIHDPWGIEDSRKKNKKNECECGAAHTSFKQFHMSFCPLNK